MVCPNCGNKCESGQKFCPECGEPIFHYNSEEEPKRANETIIFDTSEVKKDGARASQDSDFDFDNFKEYGFDDDEPEEPKPAKPYKTVRIEPEDESNVYEDDYDDDDGGGRSGSTIALIVISCLLAAAIVFALIYVSVILPGRNNAGSADTSTTSAAQTEEFTGSETSETSTTTSSGETTTAQSETTTTTAETTTTQAVPLVDRIYVNSNDSTPANDRSYLYLYTDGNCYFIEQNEKGLATFYGQYRESDNDIVMNVESVVYTVVSVSFNNISTISFQKGGDDTLFIDSGIYTSKSGDMFESSESYSIASQWGSATGFFNAYSSAKSAKVNVAETLNLRSGPGTEYDVLTKIDNAETVTLLGENSAGNWYYIRYNSYVGWVFKDYIQL